MRSAAWPAANACLPGGPPSSAKASVAGNLHLLFIIVLIMPVMLLLIIGIIIVVGGCIRLGPA
ncbi:MAG TPA: hypothetical protein VJQ45_04630 [Ktedonobacterales bacterium]|nr:hypothetical protein [Ktedonobacterales bacterium]